MSALQPDLSVQQLANVRITGELDQARQIFFALQQHALALGVALRNPPPEPTSCCGRGCNGCVWEGFYAATEFWRQDAAEACMQALASSGMICTESPGSA